MRYMDIQELRRMMLLFSGEARGYAGSTFDRAVAHMLLDLDARVSNHENELIRQRMESGDYE